MKSVKIITHGAINSSGVFIYILGVSWLMFNAESFLGGINSFLGPATFLLLFVLSATVTGSLVLARPIHFYLCGYKKDSFLLLFYTIGFMFLFLIILLVISMLANL